MAFRAGDVVKHRPSGEEWVLACDEESTGYVWPAGWPESLAKASECELIEPASNAERDDMLARVSESTGMRAHLAKRQRGSGR